MRLRWRAPDDLGIALASFRRAIRAHRRLARLAPAFFDSMVIERERAEREERRRWNESSRQAFLKIYGAELRPPPDPGLPHLPPRRVQTTVERELASWRLWFEIGTDAFQRFRIRRPHALVDLSRLAHLIEIASEFGRFACPEKACQSCSPPATINCFRS